MEPNGELTEVTELEANRSFYKQVLTGDSCDGYPGCPNVGVNAKFFSSDDWLKCYTELDFWQLVQGQYLLATKKLFDRHEVTELEANRNFYKQVLTGDSCDGYPGCPNVGVSAKFFSSDDWLKCYTEIDFWQLVQGQYLLATKKLFDRHEVTDPLKFCMQMARVARILRPGEYDHEKEKPVLWDGPG